MTTFTIEKAPKNREDLFLPILFFPVADPTSPTNWIDQLGEKAFCAWLKFQTLADRTTDITKIPRSLESLAKILNISKPTLYNKIIKPLWNFGLIDLVEFDDERVGRKKVNVIVYPYPQNLKRLENKPLEKFRNYDTDYQSDARVKGLQGGRPTKEERVLKESTGKRILTVGKQRLLKRNAYSIHRKRNFTVPVKEILPNNNKRVLNNKKVLKKKESPKLKFTDVDLENAKLLYDKMCENKVPSLKINLEKWANEFRLLREQSKEPDKTIKYIIEFSQRDSFWKNNIRSAGTFRDKYDRLYLKAEENFKAQANEKPELSALERLKEKYKAEEEAEKRRVLQ